MIVGEVEVRGLVHTIAGTQFEFTYATENKFSENMSWNEHTRSWQDPTAQSYRRPRTIQ